MQTIYDRLGVRTIVNATGPATRLGGGPMADEVIAAMGEAARHSVDMAELQAWAGAAIAELTGAEAGYVTSGAAAGLLLATAACVTGLHPGRMNRLPDTTGMKDEVLIPRSHRNFYDHAIRGVGVRLVEVGLPDRFSGAGVRDTEAWEIAEAITDRTAAVAYVAGANVRPRLPELVAAVRPRGVPVIVDAAAQLPPASNLRRFVAEGADLVCFSGGKAIGGPQGAGILCGRRELIAAAALQHLDMDVLFELWDPPASLIDKARLPGAPQHGLGRPCKVGKEAIVGLVTALRLFVAEGDEARAARWRRTVDALLEAIGTLPHAAAVASQSPGRPVPLVRLTLDEAAAGCTALELARRLGGGIPAIQVNPIFAHEGVLLFNPMCLRDGDAERIGRRLRELLR